MSGRHTTPADGRPKLAALPDLIGQAARLAPRQLNDEIALAKIELKNRGVQAGVGAGLFGVALVFLGLLVVALVVAAILGLATVMPGWLAALIVSAAFLVILAIAALVGMVWVKKAMPFVPADAVRGMRYDIGIVTEGRNFDPRLLDPSTIQYKRAQATKEAEKARAKLEKEAQDRARGKVKLPPPSEEELRARLDKRRAHLLDVRDGLVAEMNVKRQTGYLAEDLRASLASATRPRRSVPAGRTRRASVTAPASSTSQARLTALASSTGPAASTAPASSTGPAALTAPTHSTGLASSTVTVSSTGPAALTVGAGATGTGSSRTAGAAEALKERWAPLTVFTVSATAFVVFLRQLVKS